MAGVIVKRSGQGTDKKGRNAARGVRNQNGGTDSLVKAYQAPDSRP